MIDNMIEKTKYRMRKTEMREVPIDRMKYWDGVYASRPSTELGWYQKTPEISLSMIHSLGLDGDQGIIDIGGGDSVLAELLLEGGYTDLSLLDVSQQAINRSRARLGAKAQRIDWIVSDILDYDPGRVFDLWHDRACFHFLNSEEEVSYYCELASRSVRSGGYLILGAFASNGPEVCSGLPVKRYEKEELEQVFRGFELQHDHYPVHLTPSGAEQNYIFCVFRRKP